MNEKENIRLLASFLIAGALITGILWLLGKFVSPQQTNNQLPDSGSISVTSNDNISLGEEIFITKNNSTEKIEGSKAFAKGDFATAVQQFTAALNKNRNDPETLIYLNNANAESHKSNTKPIKVSVLLPLGTVDQAEETLRGVAQAQDALNNSRDKINGAWLQLQIAAIPNFRDTQAIESLNRRLIDDPSILASVGFTRDPSIYNDRKLVMVSTGNVSSRQSFQGQQYVFYATHKPSIFSDKLAEYIVKRTGIKNIAICKDSSSQQTQDRSREPSINRETLIKLHQESIKSSKYQGKVTNTNCDFGDSTPVGDILRRARTDGAEGLLLFPSYRSINNPNSKFFELIRENKKQGELPLFGYQNMYNSRMLKYGRENLNKMVLAVPWHRDANPDNPFSTEASHLWGGEVSPHTAIVYDALQAIITGLREDSTREGLQKTLSKPDFVAFGAAGRIKFSPQGERDREGGVFLVRVEPCNSGRGCESDSQLRFNLIEN
ncbi:ABC transporter substrate-binding protein [Scytonema sp. NUACC26]|uniref:ABC transporter substrate-binding protein n=1 Tax=Scytonema sp. NUACC26 TaxID=3140176 RepID=UPI0034DCBADC